jgi:hypothetical protein
MTTVDISKTAFTREQLTMILRALTIAACRLETQARSNPRGRNCSIHEKSAAEMRTLQHQLARKLAEQSRPGSARIGVGLPAAGRAP